MSDTLRQFLQITGDPSLELYLARHGQTLDERLAWAATSDTVEARYLLAHGDALRDVPPRAEPELPGFAPDQPIGALTTMDCITNPIDIPIQDRPDEPAAVEPQLRRRPNIVEIHPHDEEDDDDLDQLVNFAYEEARTLQLQRRAPPQPPAESAEAPSEPSTDVPTAPVVESEVEPTSSEQVSSDAPGDSSATSEDDAPTDDVSPTPDMEDTAPPGEPAEPPEGDVPPPASPWQGVDLPQDTLAPTAAAPAPANAEAPTPQPVPTAPSSRSPMPWVAAAVVLGLIIAALLLR